jgi:hypothetical protein
LKYLAFTLGICAILLLRGVRLSIAGSRSLGGRIHGCGGGGDRPLRRGDTPPSVTVT